MHRPGVELAIFRSQVRRPNHYTTEPPELVGKGRKGDGGKGEGDGMRGEEGRDGRGREGIREEEERKGG